MNILPKRWDLNENSCDAYIRQHAPSSALHWHSHYLLILITGGNGVQSLNGKDYEFEKGQLFLLSPVDFHKNTTDERGFDYYGVKFHYDFSSDRLHSVFENIPFPLCARLENADFKRAEDFMKTLTEECKSSEEGACELCKCLVESLLIMAARNRQRGEENAENPLLDADTDLRLVEAVKYIETHFREDISVESVGKYVGYSSHYFSCLFKKRIGISCGAYIQTCRLEFAKKLLKIGELSVTEVSYESGFGSPSYFASVFKRTYNCTPQEFALANSTLEI
ncbi:MAG: helix-turn-helix domain-containing protein [Ruminococcaceae bacterium]|nr:helix-turn-helix domain-containing protein [Oscillospiraceae bacterium]